MSTRKKDNIQKPQQPRGQSLVEFAILAPILLLLILGAMDFGRMFYTKIVLTNAAREGANFLALNPKIKIGDNDPIERTVFPGHYTDMISFIEQEATSSGIDSSMLTIPEPESCCTSYEEVAVTVQINGMNLIFGNLYQLFLPAGETINLSSTARMMVH